VSGDSTIATAADHTIIVRRTSSGGRALMAIVRLHGAGWSHVSASEPGKWEVVLTTEDADFVPDPSPPGIVLDEPSVRFARPGAVLVASPVAEQ
jgi:hypothetical protein